MRLGGGAVGSPAGAANAAVGGGALAIAAIPALAGAKDDHHRRGEDHHRHGEIGRAHV